MPSVLIETRFCSSARTRANTSSPSGLGRLPAETTRIHTVSGDAAKESVTCGTWPANLVSCNPRNSASVSSSSSVVSDCVSSKSHLLLPTSCVPVRGNTCCCALSEFSTNVVSITHSPNTNSSAFSSLLGWRREVTLIRTSPLVGSNSSAGTANAPLGPNTGCLVLLTAATLPHAPLAGFPLLFRAGPDSAGSNETTGKGTSPPPLSTTAPARCTSPLASARALDQTQPTPSPPPIPPMTTHQVANPLATLESGTPSPSLPPTAHTTPFTPPANPTPSSAHPHTPPTPRTTPTTTTTAPHTPPDTHIHFPQPPLGVLSVGWDRLVLPCRVVCATEDTNESEEEGGWGWVGGVGWNRLRWSVSS